MATSDTHQQCLINKLDELTIDGPGRGGPYTGVQHNKITEEIVAAGKEIVPLLIDNLEQGSLVKTIFIIFCLHELKAKEAKPYIERLALSKRFANVERDMTLEMQINFFLRDVDSW